MISKVFHLLVTAYYFFVAYYCHTQLDFSKATHPSLLNLKKLHLRFFTEWNIMLQCLCFSVCLFDDAFSLTPATFLAKLKTKLRAWRSFIFLGLAFPSTMLVAFVFWSFFNYDRELIYPAVVDSVIPLWLNHAIHTAIVVIAGLEVVLTSHSCSRRQGILGINIYLGLYEACILITLFTQELWVYPFYKLMTWPQIVGVGVLLHVVATGFFFLGSEASSSLWRQVGKKSNKQSKQQTKAQPKQKQKPKSQQAKQSPQQAKQSPQQAKQSPQPPKKQAKQEPSPQPKQQTTQQPKQLTKQQSPQQQKQQSPQAPKQVSKQSPQQSKPQSKQNGNTIISKKKEKMK